MPSVFHRLIARTPRSVERDIVALELDDGRRLEVQRVRDPRAKRLKLSVDERGARLTLPWRASLVSGDRFLQQHRDWLAEQIKVNVVSAMINADGKVPYTDAGIRIIVAAMRQALDLGVARGGIAPEEVDPDDDRVIPSYTISVPASANIAFNDKANRVLNDVKFTARLAGAIHVVNINGSLTYNL